MPKTEVEKQKIYIASSWKMKETCHAIAHYLRFVGYEVDLFCEEREGRTVFSFDKVDAHQDMNCIEMLGMSIVQDAFQEDKKWLDWCDICLLILPSGRSAHLEAGYAKGQGKKLWIVGDFKPGEYDVMYGFADKVFMFSDLFQYVNIKALIPDTFPQCDGRCYLCECYNECRDLSLGSLRNYSTLKNAYLSQQSLEPILEVKFPETGHIVNYSDACGYDQSNIPRSFSKRKNKRRRN